MIAKLLALTQIKEGRERGLSSFNATLPILLEVIKKTKSQHYLLKVGHKLLETKSLKELEIGGRYFALMRQSSSGALMLSNLKSEPKIPDFPLCFSWRELKEEKPRFTELKDHALTQLSESKSKQEFELWMGFLFALQRGIWSFWIDEEEKKSFVQFKKRSQGLEFYALFPHLGEICGKLELKARNLRLELYVGYEGVKSFLEEQAKSLKGISLEIKLKDRISPLFLPQEQLLDLKI